MNYSKFWNGCAYTLRAITMAAAFAAAGLAVAACANVASLNTNSPDDGGDYGISNASEFMARRSGANDEIIILSWKNPPPGAFDEIQITFTPPLPDKVEQPITLAKNFQSVEVEGLEITTPYIFSLQLIKNGEGGLAKKANVKASSANPAAVIPAALASATGSGDLTTDPRVVTVAGLDLSIKANITAVMSALVNDGKTYYSLDLSGCGAPEWMRIDPLEGAEKVVKLVLPGSTAAIAESLSYYDSTFGLYTNLREISGANVTAIRAKAFYYNEKLTTVSFPKAETIGERAFANTGLLSATFPSVKTIGERAFDSAEDLTELAFAAVHTIGEMAFSDCANLATITAKPKVLGRQFAKYCHKITGIYNDSENYPGVATLEAAGLDLSQVETLEDYAFGGWGEGSDFWFGLTTITLPAVKTIGANAFSGCGNLETVTAKPKAIGDNAFGNQNQTCPKLAGAASLGAITLDLSEAQTIGNEVFAGWSLTALELPAAAAIGESAFKDSAIATLTIPAAQSLAGAFQDCSITDVYAGAAPPAEDTPSSVFGTGGDGNITIHVPAGAQTAWSTWITDDTEFDGDAARITVQEN
jgi:hypothetical protein